jgi:hypothetical protein
VLDAERADIAESSKEVRNQDVGRDDANEIVGDESPDSKLGALSNGSSGEQGENEQRRVPG